MRATCGCCAPENGRTRNSKSFLVLAISLYNSLPTIHGHFSVFATKSFTAEADLQANTHKTNDTRPWINRDGRGGGSADWGERVCGWVGNTGKKNCEKKQWERTVGNKTKGKNQGKKHRGKNKEV